ncbi:MAG TPA: hypothetical protein VGG72_27690 [Bryobacteraceae bacterium]|jgi:hypothetical protein
MSQCAARAGQLPRDRHNRVSEEQRQDSIENRREPLRRCGLEQQRVGLPKHAILHSDPIGALAHLQLGRALALSGDKIKAKTAYQGFLTLWKDAYANIPILDKAHKEYATLQ